MNPDGTISYVFDGKVIAKGIDLDSTYNAPTTGRSYTAPALDKDSIQWLDRANPTKLPVASIGATHSDNALTNIRRSLTLRTSPPDPDPLLLSRGSTSLGMQSGDVTGPATATLVNVSAGSEGRRIIDGDGRSSFLNLGFAGETRRSGVGKGTLTWGAAGRQSSLLSITGVPANTPLAAIVATADAVAGGVFVVMRSIPLFALLQGEAGVSVAAGTTVPVYWIWWGT